MVYYFLISHVYFACAVIALIAFFYSGYVLKGFFTEFEFIYQPPKVFSFIITNDFIRHPEFLPKGILFFHTSVIRFLQPCLPIGGINSIFAGLTQFGLKSVLCCNICHDLKVVAIETAEKSASAQKLRKSCFGTDIMS